MLQASSFKTEKVGPNTNLVREITLPEARALFGNKMYGPKEVQQFAESRPKEFDEILCSTSLYMGFALSTNNPLLNYIQKGMFRISVKIAEEERIIEIPENKLIKAGREMGQDILNQKNKLLLIKSGYTINQSGNAFTVVFDKGALDNLAQHIELLNNPSENGWYGQINGMPVGKASTKRDPGSLLYRHSYCIDFGSVRRGYGVMGGYDNVIVNVGGGLDYRLGVLVSANEPKYT